MATQSTYSPNKIQPICQCNSKGRENHTVVADMDETLLIHRSSFPYFALVAFDVGGILRLLLLLLASPLAWFLHNFVSQSAGLKVLIFVTFAGVKVSDIESAANAILPKHYSEDLHPETWRVLSSCARKYVVTMSPRIMVEPFLKKYLGVDLVLGTEIMSWKGIAMGFVAGSGVLVGKEKGVALVKAFESSSSVPDIGIGGRGTDISFMNLCKEKYIVPWKPGIRPVKPDELPNPVIFHDGRLVQTPTPFVTLLIILWFPIAVPLSIVRVFLGSLCSVSQFYYIVQLLGCQIKVKGTPPPNPVRHPQQKGFAIVCSHRNVLDPLFVSAVLRHRPTTCVTYSVSKFTEFVAIVRTCRLTRDRSKDAKLIRDILEQGRDLVVCPEGTTCREPYLLRFSSLFAELTDRILPVAVSLKVSMFHGSTVRGHKWLDIFFFLMNPSPVYEITFLDMLSPEQTCSSGKSSYEVANNVQEMIAKALKFKCTNLTRKDKYRMLAGTDGLVREKPGARSS
ncbi:Glycerol-3-phosphate 2-O-acyltransferase [Handroanthus impetiginosus]|uniref:Glycerol-3-phosphate 2-O-acyltransferase n=1 Tax=Handroanthus impetiginosus TaxID=429701 RepID=A0A2G9GY16_9LAMI|nr:Glycerol-3-phosphate 2-O-acyltransferase [Handroanthus impetiginosus]